MDANLEIYSNIVYDGKSDQSLLQATIEHVRMAERFSYNGTLITTGNRKYDPWLFATIIIQNTQNFIPLIAVQPYTMPPYTTAKMIQTIEFIYKRKVNLNYVTGIRGETLEQISDALDHDDRYLRLGEYIRVVNSVLTTNEPVTFYGKYYRLNKLDMRSETSLRAFPRENLPETFVAGSSKMGKQIALEYGDGLLSQPGPANIYRDLIDNEIKARKIKLAIGIGIIARSSAKEAWEFAQHYFPKDRGALILATRLGGNSQSQWIRTMAGLASSQEVYDDVYWLGSAYSKTYYPYLVGNYEQVAEYLKLYLDIGVRTMIVNGPYTVEEFAHRDKVFKILNRLFSM